MIFDLPTRPNNDSIWFFEPKARRRFDRIFTNPQGTAACYRFWYRNIQEVFAPRMPTIRPYFAENSQTNRPYYAEENRPFAQGPTEMFRVASAPRMPIPCRLTAKSFKKTSLDLSQRCLLKAYRVRRAWKILTTT